MTYATVAATYRPQTRSLAWTYDIALVTGASVAVALSAQIAVALPFSPVPVTGQTFAVLLVGALLGPQRAVAALLLYIAEGMAGLPVFAGGTATVAVLAGPTGGYLAGFVVAAGIVGALSERGWDRGLLTTLLAMTLGTAIIFLFGVTRLAFYLSEGSALQLGLYPFIPGALAKIVLAALLLPLGWRLPGLRDHRRP